MTIGGALAKVAAGIPRMDLLGLAAVQARFTELVDEPLRSHARPIGLDEGVLKVAVDAGIWATQLRLLGTDLIQALSESGEVEIQRIEVVVQAPEKP